MLNTAPADTEPTTKETVPVHPKKKGMLIPSLVVLIGISVLLYPVIATQWNNIKQQEITNEYKSFIKETDTSELEASIQRADDYNKNRATGPILDPWTGRLADDNEPYKDYLAQLNLTSTMARIVIPVINVDLPVFHGSRSDTLERGIGHLFGTDLPVGGENTHAVLTGHTGLQTATLFDNLKDITEGDSIYIDVYGEKLRYVVYETEVVLPDEAKNLYKIDGKDLLTLITCTPYGINSHRLLVHAERAPMDPQAEHELTDASGFAIQWWMWLFIAGATLALLAMVWYIRKNKRQHAVDSPVSPALTLNTTATPREEPVRISHNLEDATEGEHQ